MTKISVIVPFHNAERTLGACLDALCALEHGDFEVILVDDASTDASADIAAVYPFTVLHLEKNQGAGEARNRGCSIAQGEILAFTDADCVVPSNWLIQIENALRDGIAGITGVYELPDDATFLARFVGYDIRVRFLRLAGNTDVFGTYNCAISRRAFDAVGGFDSQIKGASWEDVDFGLRVIAKNYRLVIDPTNAVRHRHPDRPLNYFRKQAKKSGGQVFMRLEGRRSSYVDMSATLQVPLTILLCTCLLFIPWMGWLGLLGILSLATALVILNWPLLKIIAEHEGLWKSIYSFALVIFRNFAWCTGIITAISGVPFSSWRKGQKIG